MGKVVLGMKYVTKALGLGGVVQRIVSSPTLADQVATWEGAWPVALFSRGPRAVVDAAASLLAFTVFNRFVLWFGAGVPCKQYRLISDDGVRLSTYAARTMDGVARHSHLRTDNYFYLCCLLGRFTRECCPAYLKPDAAARLGGGLVDRLTVATGTFMDALTSRTYDKVILMDHVDWQDEAAAAQLAAALAAHVAPGGRVIWRSAARAPFYAKTIASAGFDVTRLQCADAGYMDRVNMYSSFYVAVRRA